MGRNVYCAVAGCFNFRGTPKVRFHCFPNVRKRADLWALSINRPDIAARPTIYRSTVVCSDHFEPSMYVTPSRRLIDSLLLPTAVPHIDPYPTDSESMEMPIMRRSKSDASCQTNEPEDLETLRKLVASLKRTISSLQFRLEQETNEKERLLYRVYGNALRKPITVRSSSDSSTSADDFDRVARRGKRINSVRTFKVVRGRPTGLPQYPKMDVRPSASLENPNVRLAPHPFYERLSEGALMQLTTLKSSTRRFVSKGAYKATFRFYLSHEEAILLTDERAKRKCPNGHDSGLQIVVRFCKIQDNSTIEQEDSLPIHLALKCNSAPVSLENPLPTSDPSMGGRRRGRPINITPEIHASPVIPNILRVTWRFDPSHHLQSQMFALGVFLVKRLSPTDLMAKLTVKPPEFAKSMIRQKMTSSDSEIVTNKLHTSLLCPLGKTRIERPLRGSLCTHLQCFDAFCFLAMNERRPTWRCPHCDQPASFDKLYIDGFFEQLLAQSHTSVSAVQFFDDCTWAAVPDADDVGSDLSPPSKLMRMNHEVERIESNADIDAR